MHNHCLYFRLPVSYTNLQKKKQDCLNYFMICDSLHGFPLKLFFILLECLSFQRGQAVDVAGNRARVGSDPGEQGLRSDSYPEKTNATWLFVK